MGVDPSGDRPGEFGLATEAAVRDFQAAQGLPVNGVCDDATWRILVEACWSLGDRLLYHRLPMLRGEDVADLQRRLGRLGFDAGRVDGIFGPATAHAVEEFQLNSGLPPDGICGYETIRALERLGGRTGNGPSVAVVREHDHLRRSEPTLVDRRIVVGHRGSLGALVRTVVRQLRLAGAAVIALDEPDPSAQATATNRFGADLFVGLVATDGPASVAYYAVSGFESVGGRRLAELVVPALAPLLPGVHGPVGLRHPVLRETRMPAVLCELAPMEVVLDRLPELAEALTGAITAWASTPIVPR